MNIAFIFNLSSLEYGTEELSRLSLRSYVNIVCAKLVSLNRAMKLAILDDETVVPYDHLLLCTGNQFPVIAPMQANVISPLSRKAIPAKFDRILFGNCIPSILRRSKFLIAEPAPPNVLTINDEYDAAMAVKWLRMNHHSERTQKMTKLNFKNSCLFYRFNFDLWNDIGIVLLYQCTVDQWNTSECD